MPARESPAFEKGSRRYGYSPANTIPKRCHERNGNVGTRENRTSGLSGLPGILRREKRSRRNPAYLGGTAARDSRALEGSGTRNRDGGKGRFVGGNQGGFRMICGPLQSGCKIFERIFSGCFEHVTDGGEGGIRTHGRGKPTHAFQACSLNHSDTSPRHNGTL